MVNFNEKKQYRCTIIRGKSKSDLDNLLPLYAKIIQEICPCPKEDFTSQFNNKLSLLLSVVSKKTLDNHRTEIAGKLFGMYYIDSKEIIYPSERTLSYIEKQDQPEFFKDMCAKFQFPNGMDSPATLKNKMDKEILIQPFSFILELLYLAKNKSITITKDEVAFFILNSLEVLQGKISPILVLDKILKYKEMNKSPKVNSAGKATSYSMQHITEQLNLLELANLVRIRSGIIYLNSFETEAIDYIRSLLKKELGFNIYHYNVEDREQRNRLYYDWQIYYSSLDSEGAKYFGTSVESIQFTTEEKKKAPTFDTTALGDEGELFIFNYEKDRVSRYDPRLVKKVLLLGRTKGLGYDIQSIIADNSEFSEFVQYIEVKATKRVTAPDLKSDSWIDSVNLTRNEWVAAMQHKDSFSIYRVYFTPQKIIVFILKNPYTKSEEGQLKCIPINYRLDFSSKSVDSILEENVT